MAARHMVVQGGFHVGQGEHVHTGQQRADRHHVGKARIANLFSDFITRDGDGSYV